MENVNMDLKFIQSESLDSDPVVVFLHGYSGDEYELPMRFAEAIGNLSYLAFRAPNYFDGYAFAWTGLPDKTAVLAPEKPLPENLLAQAEASGEAIMAAVDRELGPTRKIVPFGFSQGAMMTSWLMQRYPERLAGAVLLSGYPFVDANTPTTAPNKPAFDPSFHAFVAYGTADHVLAQEPLSWLANWVSEQVPSEVHIYPGMVHTMTFEEREHIRQYFQRQFSHSS
jgi:phospholipase/carboxylesterase